MLTKDTYAWSSALSPRTKGRELGRHIKPGFTSRHPGRHVKPGFTVQALSYTGVAATGVAATGVIFTAPLHASAAHHEPVYTPPAAQYTVTHVPFTVQAAPVRHPEKYTVVPDDTLSGIAAAHCVNADAWPEIYNANKRIIGDDPNRIYPGQRYTLNCKDAGAVTAHVSTPSDPPASSPQSDPPPVSITGALSGTLSCSGLEKLWDAAGGNPGAAFMAAEIAMAESGGNQYATGSVGEEGYWQINPVNVGLATYNPYGNARSAIILSSNGTNWSPWTTYISGAYQGRC